MKNTTKLLVQLLLVTLAFPGAISFASLTPQFVGADAHRKKVRVSLREIATGLSAVTEIRFHRALPGRMYVLLKEGRLFEVDVKTGAKKLLLKLEVATRSEMGLLGMDFHPKFDAKKNRRIFLHYNRGEKSRISEWQFGREIQNERLVLELEQPYGNHNAGQIQFGPDGYLYIPFGDGGSGGDPLGHGQNTETLLGSFLRIDVDRRSENRAYGIPQDNPFLKSKKAAPETWAYGLRNVWKFAFTKGGDIIAADVGQHSYEEINFIAKGKNYGWKPREGRHCFSPQVACAKQGMAEPFYEYGRADGGSITGGYIYSGTKLPALSKKYVFGDFVSGGVWAVDIPKSFQDSQGKTKDVVTLGKWPLSISTFGQDPSGEIYLADFVGGKIYQLGAP